MSRVIVAVEHSPAIGGAARVVLSVLAALDRKRFEPVLACNAGAIAHEAAALGIEVLPLDLPMLTFAGGPAALSALGVRHVRAASSLTRAIRRRRPAVVYASGLASALHAALPARLTRTPLIWHVHEMYDARLRMRPFVAIAGASAQRVICVSCAAMERAVALGAPRHKCCVVHNALPVPLTARAPTAMAPATDPDTQTPLLVAVGAITPAKGHRTLIEAMKQVARDHSSAVAIVVGAPLHPGDDRYLEELRGELRRYRLDHVVRFIGFRPDAAALVSRAAIVVHPSVCEETFGLVPLEAMAAGRPVIASSVGGVPEVLEDGVTGILVPPGNAAALAAAISKLLDDEPLRERMGRAGRRVAAERFGQERMIGGLGEAFRDVLGESPFAEPIR